VFVFIIAQFQLLNDHINSGRMFSLLRATMLEYVPDINTINTWAEPHNANGVTPNTIIDSNDEPPANNQQRMTARNY
jgi:hypothetical protein